MKLQGLTIAILTVLVFSSCSSLHTLSARDSASSSTALKKTGSRPAKREFINGIEVTPGGVTENASAGYVSAARKEVQKKETRSSDRPQFQATGGKAIEEASMLQLKYAIATDVTVEKLTNIPLLEVIDKWWGTKYCMGGTTDGCIDCSAFTQIVMRDVYKISLPRTSQEQYAQCEKVQLEDLREGDLVFFNTSGSDVSHVGIYLLNNKFVHAATSGGVMISDLNDKYWQPKYLGAGRMLRDNELKASR